jgi:hypothetical protein
LGQADAGMMMWDRLGIDGLDITRISEVGGAVYSVGVGEQVVEWTGGWKRGKHNMFLCYDFDFVIPQ